MENSSTNSSEKKSSGKTKESKCGGFPGFKDEVFDRKALMEMEKVDLYRLYRLYGAQIVKDFYTLVGVITTPTRFNIHDFPKRPLVIKRLNKSNSECKKMMMWMKNVLILNDVVYQRLVLEKEDGDKENSGKVKKSQNRIGE